MHYVKTCPICGQPLTYDDVDFNFEGNQNEYSDCEHCHKSFIFYIRYGSLWKYDVWEEEFNESTQTWCCKEQPPQTVYVFKK